MDRREHLKILLAGSFGAGLLLTSGCSREDRQISEKIIEAGGGYGRTAEEAELDRRLRAGSFLTEEEYEIVGVLADIIMPSDEESVSATEAGVPDFIEFMMKDYPAFQVPVRGGIMWLNSQCISRFDKTFLECSEAERLEMIEEIAWPDKARPEMAYGVNFFNRMRDLVSTGFFTSEPGVRYLGYMGNMPNVWDGVPQEVLDKHGLAYDQKTLDECIKPEDRGRLAEWDEHGNIL